MKIITITRQDSQEFNSKINWFVEFEYTDNKIYRKP